jgi:glyoxylase-like metal-dependent hydrolase (beta-lactamase superfamily II)
MAEPLCDGLWLVGGSHLTDPRDCLIYALDLGALVLVDSGVGPGWGRLHEELLVAGLDPDAVHTLVLTHAHVDHIGAAAAIVRDTGCRVVAHTLDAAAIETGDPEKTAASWYQRTLPPLRVDHRVAGEAESLVFPGGRLELLHTPGHTPGSMVALAELGRERVLFGQDIHGPFSPGFGSDVAAWRLSMERLLALEATILCEGHFGVFRPAAAVRRFIEDQLRAHRRDS